MLPGGRDFYVEVKTLDISAAGRHDEIMVDAINRAVDLEEQIAEGKAVAIREGEVAPSQRLGDRHYDPRSLMRVIGTLREKFQQAFKAGQFELGRPSPLSSWTGSSFPAGNRLRPVLPRSGAGTLFVGGALWHADSACRARR